MISRGGSTTKKLCPRGYPGEGWGQNSKVSVITLGSCSKGSKGINLSEDIFAGFNMMLRGVKGGGMKV